MSNFNDLIQLIRSGEPLSASVPNRPIRGLDERTRYLWDVLQAAATGSAVFARQVSVDPAVAVGQPVYYNAATARFEKALCASVSDPATGKMVLADSAHCWGVVWSKINATLADLLLMGYASLNLTAALPTGTAAAAGLYYLSGTTAGQLTRTPPAAAIPVLRADGAGRVFVNPRWGDPLREHIHEVVELIPAPAGSFVDPGEGNPLVITSPDASLEGWLPANHAIFNGTAPTGAAFGYNWRANPTLRADWPPLPPDTAVLSIDGTPVWPALVRIDLNGIWWMSDSRAYAPWPLSSDSAASDSDPLGSPSMRLSLSYTRFAFLNEANAVTSLQSDDDRVVIECATALGQPATRGALVLRLNLQFLNGGSSDAAATAIKRYDELTQRFEAGPIASGLYSLSNHLSLTGEQTQTRSIGGLSRTVHYGAVGLDLSDSVNRELFVELVRLDGVGEEYYQDVMYLGLPVGIQSSLRARIHVPETLDVDNPRLQLKLRLLGRSSGTLPALTITGRRIPAAAAATALPTADSAVTLDTAVDFADADSYQDVASSPITIAPGDDYLFTITRSASDGYAGEVGLLRLVGLVASA